MKILLNAVGSHGDVLPLIAMGRELLRRGHRPHLFANGAFEAMAQEAGLPFSATGAADDLARLLKNRDGSDPRKGMSLMASVVMQGIRQTYPLLCREYEPGETIAVGTSLAWATRLLSETHVAPVVVVHLAPSWFRSEHVAPSLGPIGHLARAPRWVKRWAFAGMDKRFLDPLFTAPLNRLRAELGLAPVRRSFHMWIHQVDAVLGMFPDWFAVRQADWPPQLQLMGFPLHDQGNAAALPDAVLAFLAAGKAPVLVTAGTATQAQSAFFDASIQACQRSGRRAILMTQDATQLPPTLPAGMAHFPYVPFQLLLPRVAALIHHGGIGTTSQAMRAGVPQLIRPMGFDQFDNALRAVQLGVAQQLLPRRYGPESAAAALRALTTSEEVRTRCREVAGRLGQGGGVDAACDAVIRLCPDAVLRT